jgi:hypothetical protein
MISLNSKVMVAEGLATADLGEEVVILQFDSGVYFGLNEVGARIWQLLQEPKSVSEIEEALVAEYDIDRESCSLDLVELLQQLTDQKLIVITNGESSS